MSAPRLVPRSQFFPLVSAETKTPGQRLVPQIDNLPRDVNGYPAHILGLYVRLLVTYSTVAATMATAAQGWRLFNILQTFTFKVGNHSFIDGVQGARLFHDSRRLALGDVVTAPSSIADGDATNSQATIDLYIPFALPRTPAGAEYDGAFPVAALRNGDFEAVFAAATGLGFAGLTWSTSTVSIWAHLHHGTQLRIPTPWRVRVREEMTKTITDNPAGFMYYADFWDQHEAEVPNAAAYAGIEVAIGDATLKASGSLERVLEHNVDLGRRLSSYTALSTTAPDYLPIIRASQGDLVTRQPRGKLRVVITARPVGVTNTALQMRERGTRHVEYMAEMIRRLGCGPDTVIEARSSKKHCPEWLKPHCDASVSWSGMPYAGVAERQTFRGR